MTTQYDPATAAHGSTNGLAYDGTTVPPAPMQSPRPGAPGRAWSPGQERLPRVRRPRRPALAAGGVLLILLCGATGAAVATAGDHSVRVLALARDVQAGQVLTAEDLKVAQISGSGVSALGAAGDSNVVGETVTATLPAGTLLNPSMVTRAPLPTVGLQVVAIAVKPGGAPAQALPGRDVSIIRVATAADPKTTQPAVLVAKARLVSVRTDTASGLQILSVQVPAAAAVAVAQASAAGAVAVSLLPVTP
jgi:hypothetical protein